MTPQTLDPPTALGVLNRGADILTAQGWTQDQGYEHTRGLEPEESPVDLVYALALAAGVDLQSTAVHNPVGVHADAVRLLARRVFGTAAAYEPPAVRALDNLTDWQDETGRTAEQVIAAFRGTSDLVYPAPGADVPGQPGFVVATCGHRVAAQEWRAGMWTCERDPEQPIDRYARAVYDALTAAKIPCHPPRVGAGISIELPAADASLNWSIAGDDRGWSLHGRGPRNAQINTARLAGLAPIPSDVATLTLAWALCPAERTTERRDPGLPDVDELNELLDRAAQGQEA